MLLQELHGVVDEIVEVHGVGREEAPHILLVYLRDLELAVIAGRGGVRPVLGGPELGVLGVADLPEHAAGRKALLVEVLLLQDALDQRLAVRRVIDREVVREAELFRVPAQDAHAGGVEGAGPDVVGLVAQHVGEAVLELAGGFVREGDGEDAPGLHRAQRRISCGLRPALLQQAEHLLVCIGGQLVAVGGAAVAEEVRDAVDQHRGLAAPGPGQDQQRALCGQHGLLLSFI